MTEAEALTRLQHMVQSDEEPVLPVGSLEELLAIARRTDVDGLAPSQVGWQPTWDLNTAAAEGWRWKAGSVAGRFNITADGASLMRAQAVAHCLQMAQVYANKVVGSLIVTTRERLVESEL